MAEMIARISKHITLENSIIQAITSMIKHAQILLYTSKMKLNVNNNKNATNSV